MIREFCIPTHLVFGVGATDKLGEFMKKKGYARPLVVTDQGLVKAGVAGAIVDKLKAAGLSPMVFDGVVENPPERVVLSALDLVKKEKLDSLVAVGGGSSMDTAKAVGILMTNPGPLTKYEGPDKLDTAPQKIIAVPTTAGTGSEVTGTAVVSLPEKKYKMSIRSGMMPPEAAFLDPVVMEGLPFGVAAATGLDALTHALEAFTTTLSNNYTDGLAIQAMALISDNLRQFCANRKNHEASLNMLLASNLAGQAFTWARVAAAHAMSIPLGGQFNIPHGLATAICMPAVMRFNLIACPEKYAQVAELLGGDTEGLTLMEAAELSVDMFEELMDDLECPRALTEVGAKAEEMDEVVEKCVKSGIATFNPRTVSRDDFRRLLEECL